MFLPASGRAKHLIYFSVEKVPFLLMRLLKKFENGIMETTRDSSHLKFIS
jgi:hypothetical protein